MKYNLEFKTALKHSIPVMMGYVVLGFAFGLLMSSYQYEWYWTLWMSLFIYAGALQFAAVGFFSAKLGLIDIAIASFFINIRQSFYGLSMLKKYAKSGWIKPYLIHTLTDETYAILTSIKISEKLSYRHYAIFLSALNQSYWVIGSVTGAFFGAAINFDTRGITFSLTALFIVLAIEQYKARKNITPFVVGAIASLVSMMLLGNNMLLGAILLSLAILFGLRGYMQKGNIDG
ncbi:MAG: AzlC family ABC transporter permease [Sulfurovum sp.]|nr:AzlC family ABC transporter permease [Sulfurovum sp.]